MKKFLLGFLIVFVLVVAGLSLVGLSPWALKANIDVGVGMGAKLACSGRYLTGLDEEQVYADLSSYTPATDLLDIEYNDTRQQVEVSLFGFSTSATYRPGIGCTLDLEGSERLDNLIVEPIASTNAPWPRGAAVDTLRDAVQSQAESLLAADNAAGLQTRALLVAHRGDVVAEAYAEGFGPDTPLLGWSMAKSLTAIMLGHLQFSGELNESDRNLFEAWSEDERAEISLKDLLQMVSGLEFDETYAPGSDATYMLFSAPSAFAVARDKPLAYPIGSHFSYSSGTANLLSTVFVERSGGVQQAFTRLYNGIFRPMGMAHTILEPDPSGIFVGSSYAYASARDWARLGQLMLNQGTLNGTRLLNADWVRAASTPNTSDDPRYGYQFWLNSGGTQPRWPSLPADAYAMTGNRAQTVMIVPSAEAVLVRLGWTAGRYPTDENFAALLAAIER